MLPHIVTSNLEHGSVLRTAQELADNGEIGKNDLCSFLKNLLFRTDCDKSQPQVWSCPS